METSTLTLVRTFRAPKSRVFQYWTHPDKTKQWWWPKDFTCPSAKIDFRIGGKYHLAMQSSDGKMFWSTGTYQQIVDQKMIVCSDSFSDEKWNIVPAKDVGMIWEWPLELMITIIFDEKNGVTKMTLTHEWLPPEIVNDCRLGWNQSFDKLEAIL